MNIKRWGGLHFRRWKIRHYPDTINVNESSVFYVDGITTNHLDTSSEKTPNPLKNPLLVRFGQNFVGLKTGLDRTVRSWTNRFWSVDPWTAWRPCKVKRILIYDFRMSVNQWKYARCWKVKKNVYLIYSMINSFGQRNENKITENYINIDK